MAWFRCRVKSRVIVVDEMAVGQVFLGILLFSSSVFFHIGPYSSLLTKRQMRQVWGLSRNSDGALSVMGSIKNLISFPSFRPFFINFCRRSTNLRRSTQKYRVSLSLEAPNYCLCIQSNSAGFSFVNTGRHVHLKHARRHFERNLVKDLHHRSVASRNWLKS